MKEAIGIRLPKEILNKISQSYHVAYYVVLGVIDKLS